jgi:hypothetical protein
VISAMGGPQLGRAKFVSQRSLKRVDCERPSFASRSSHSSAMTVNVSSCRARLSASSCFR